MFEKTRLWLWRFNLVAQVRWWSTIAAILWLIVAAIVIYSAIRTSGASLSPFLAVYLVLNLVGSLVGAVLVALDKRRAVRGQPRISERTLHLWSLAGGWAGELLAQRFFRHKTQKISFRLVGWLILAIHMLVIGYGIWSGWIQTCIRVIFGWSNPS